MFVGLLQYYNTELLIMVMQITVIWKLNSQNVHSEKLVFS